MGIPIIGNFDLSKFAPLDARMEAVDATARLNIKWIYKGLRVKDLDTGAIFEYVGSGIINPTAPYTANADWLFIARTLTGSGTPDNGDGFDGDLYLDEANGDFYKKVSGSWGTPLFTLDGAKILMGNADPLDANGNDGDVYIQTLDGTSYLAGDVFTKTAGTWGAPQFNINGADGAAGDKYATTSASTVDLDAATDPIAITVGLGLAWTAGMSIRLVSRANPTVDYLDGTVTAYTPGSGAMSIGSITRNGTGSHTDWDVNLSGTVGLEGKTLNIDDNDIELDQNYVNTVEAGGYTPRDLFVATVQNDARVDKLATPGIKGDMAGNMIIYDGGTGAGGVGWVYTRWVGSTGNPPNLTVGTITSLPYGSQPTVTITGTTPNYTINFGIPQGKDGDNGDPASAGSFLTDQIYVKISDGTDGIAKTPSVASATPTIGVEYAWLESASKMENDNRWIWDASPPFSAVANDEFIIKGKVEGFGAQDGIDQLVELYLVASYGGSFSDSTLIPETRIHLATTRYKLQPWTRRSMEIWSAFKASKTGTWKIRLEAQRANDSIYIGFGSASYLTKPSHRSYMVIKTLRDYQPAT